jgi:hypothetical protein
MAGDDRDDTKPPNKVSDAWLFVSHSNKDAALVRRVRDELERLEAHPLLFFLKCIDDDDELDDLIKREIAARNFFILCDSEAARRSKWVQQEIAIVNALGNRKIHSLDLADPWEKQRIAIHRAVRAATTFVSYSYRDRDRVQPYVDFLKARDFAVFVDRGINAGDDFVEKITEAIHASVAGYFIAFLSNQWLASRWAQEELTAYYDAARAAEQTPHPLLIALDPPDLIAPRLPPTLMAYQMIDLSRGGIAENGPKLLRALGL